MGPWGSFVVRSVTDMTDVTNNDRLSIEVHICARTWAYMGLSVTVGHSVTERPCRSDDPPTSLTVLRSAAAIIVMPTRSGNPLWLHSGDCHSEQSRRCVALVEEIMTAAGYGADRREGEAA